MPNLLTLSEATSLVPGINEQTLLRRAREGKLTVYRVGRSYATTAEAVREMIEACRVVPKVRVCGGGKIETPGSSSTEVASAALDSALAQASKKKKPR